MVNIKLYEEKAFVIDVFENCVSSTGRRISTKH